MQVVIKGKDKVILDLIDVSGEEISWVKDTSLKDKHEIKALDMLFKVI